MNKSLTIESRQTQSMIYLVKNLYIENKKSKEIHFLQSVNNYVYVIRSCALGYFNPAVVMHLL